MEEHVFRPFFSDSSSDIVDSRKLNKEFCKKEVHRTNFQLAETSGGLYIDRDKLKRLVARRMCSGVMLLM
jgi:hypothetical protein